MCVVFSDSGSELGRGFIELGFEIHRVPDLEGGQGGGGSRRRGHQDGRVGGAIGRGLGGGR